MAEAGSDTLVVIGVEAGSKARTNYRLTCSCQGLGCKSALLWLHILCLCVHNAVETGDNAVETGDRDQGGGHAGTHESLGFGVASLTPQCQRLFPRPSKLMGSSGERAKAK